MTATTMHKTVTGLYVIILKADFSLNFQYHRNVSKCIKYSVPSIHHTTIYILVE